MTVEREITPETRTATHIPSERWGRGRVGTAGGGVLFYMGTNAQAGEREKAHHTNIGVCVCMCVILHIFQI